jgi:phosphate transport system permease protein
VSGSVRGLRGFKNAAGERIFRLMAIAFCLLPVVLAVCLAVRSAPVLNAQSLSDILLSTDWRPQQGRFGMLAYLAGTVAVTMLAMVIAVPVSLLSAIYLSEYASPAMRRMALPAVDVLSGIPSVIYGVWGLLLVVPAMERLGRRLDVWTSGHCVFAAALVLAVMVVPFVLHMAREVLAAVPRGLREASLSLGATRWQTVKKVVLRKAFPGVAAAVMLGFARAMGETIAVLMVVGNVAQIPRSLFDPAYPLPALLANNYGEMMSIPLYDSALMLAALLLLLLVALFHVLGRLAFGLVQGGEP